jgi:hypothetical protein
MQHRGRAAHSAPGGIAVATKPNPQATASGASGRSKDEEMSDLLPLAYSP